MTESSLFWIVKKLLTTGLWRSLVVEITTLKNMVKSFHERPSNSPLTTVYRIILEEKKVGGAVIKVDGEKGSLDLLFVPQMLTVRELDLLRGVKLKSYIQKSKFGRL